MKKIEVLFSIAATLFGVIITIVTCLYKFIKSAKGKKVAENVLKISTALFSYIVQAEKYVSFTGEQKKAYVMTKANQYAIDNNIKYEEDTVSKKIDELVAFTKQVNVAKNQIPENNVFVETIEKRELLTKEEKNEHNYNLGTTKRWR